MTASLTTGEVWKAIEGASFAVLSVVNGNSEPRSSGMVYVTKGRELFMHTDTASWKVRHINANPAVAVTITIPKRVPFMPWIRIPAACISFHGEAKMYEHAELPDVTDLVTKGVHVTEEMMRISSIIRITPLGHFMTYGIGVSILGMRDPDEARARVPV